ncbi:Auxin response factor 17 [Striga hermonthica]|uniref:Auxin response factor 17 n=1 Tax=Striga hermonthica TaxID=68872 RepID=A0A9N7NQN8_STRHE|nr:Auxin response factor 17 [Striga hermonthica]
MATSPSSSSAAEVDPAVWRAVVSSSVEIPPVGSHVYYFPEGHLEHSGSPPSSLRNYSFALSRPFIPCRLISVRFLADPPADQPSVRMLLRPLDPRSSSAAAVSGGSGGITEDDVISFAKALTPSDAGGGGGFSIPKFCAEVIFPPLEQPSGPRPPNQGLTVRDARGRPWEFRHIYRGTPRRHLLSTGWSRFVKAKQLVAGDVVVFVGRRSTGEVFAGVRKARRHSSVEWVYNSGISWPACTASPLLGGTQGARQDHMRRIGKTSCDLTVNEHQSLGPPPVSTVLKLGSSCQSILPPIVRMRGGDLQASCRSAFRLFGKVIETRAGFSGCSGSNCIASCTCGSD